MHPVFSVDAHDISKLTDEQARELIARLCRLELARKGVSASCVQWGGDQRAKDGGVDVYVEVDPPRGLAGYVKADNTAFQVKAEQFGPARIPDEMAPKGKLRPAIRELALANGAYVICSTRSNTSRSALEERLDKMQEVLDSFAVKPGLKIDFYDARKIADWVEAHPAAVIWVKHALGVPLQGWRPYAAWAYRESSTEAEYLLDEKTRVFTPSGEGEGVVTAINTIRGDIRSATPIRLVGLSGVGKTRLVQALFDDRIQTHVPALDSDKVIYTDTSFTPAPLPESMAEALADEGDDAILIVDNCGADLHNRLVDIIKAKGSQLRLITVEYDIRDDISDGSRCYRLEGASDDLIKKLLHDRFSFLSPNDIEVITKFSDGNFRVAFALASTTATTGELSRLRDEELFQRLFSQKHAADKDLLNCAKVASLLYSFDFEDDSSLEIDLLAGIAGVSTRTFRSMVVELFRRGLVQARGKWRAVLPHAIANRLAAQALEEMSQSSVVEPILDSRSHRVIRSFSRRLGYLHESKEARALVQKWLVPGGKYSDASALTEAGLQIVSNLAPVNPEETLQAIRRWISDEAEAAKSSRVRSRLSALLRFIAHDPKHFDESVSLLLELAHVEAGAGEGEATNHLKALFFSRLSGTEASPEQRQGVVRRLLNSMNDRDKRLGRILLDAALEARNWSCHYGFEFGARKRSYGWRPRSRADMRQWYDPFISMAADAMSREGVHNAPVRQLMARALTSLWVNAGAEDALGDVVTTVLKAGSWPEGWVGVRRALGYHRDTLPPDSLARLEVLEQTLRPANLEDEIRARVLTPGTLPDDFSADGGAEQDGKRSLEVAREKALALGEELATDHDLLKKLMPALLERTNGCGDVAGLGRGVGSLPQLEDVLEVVRSVLADQGDNARLLFVDGVIGAWSEREPAQAANFLDLAVTDEIWKRWVPELQCNAPLDERALERFTKLIADDSCSLWQYRSPMYGRATASWTIDQISRFVDLLFSKSLEHAVVAIEVLAMVVFDAKERGETEQAELVQLCLRVLERFDWTLVRGANNNLGFELTTIVKFVVNGSDIVDSLRPALSGIVESVLTEDRYFYRGLGEYLKPFFEKFPLDTLQAIFVKDSEGTYGRAESLVENEFGGSSTAVENVPASDLESWCADDPAERCEFAARTCKLLEPPQEGESATTLRFSDAAMAVMRQATDKIKVANALINRCISESDLSMESTGLDGGLGIFEVLKVNDDPMLLATIEEGAGAAREHIKWLADIEESHRRDRTDSFE